MQLKAVKIDKPDDTNFILGQTHLIKSVEDTDQRRSEYTAVSGGAVGHPRHPLATIRQGCGAGSGARTTAAPTSAPAAGSGR
jgi:hypothetical protein